MNDAISAPRHFGLQANGHLFDPGFRERLERAGIAPERRSAIEAVNALRVADRALRHSMDRWAEVNGLSEGRLHVIFFLKSRPQHQAPLGEMAGCLGVSPRNITGLVDHLERDGLVERVPDPVDRRSVQARLTEPGLRKVAEIWNPSVVRQLPAVAGMTEEEIDTLRHLCLRVVANLNRGRERDLAASAHSHPKEETQP